MKSRWVSTALLVVGAFLLVTSGGYYGLVAYASQEAANFPNEELPLEQRPSARFTPPIVTSPSPTLLTPEMARPEDLSLSDATNIIDTRTYPAPDQITIPSIEVDSLIRPVGIVTNKKGELEWETPKHSVGYHEGTATPGQFGNVVLSGHISSPIMREGNVFNRLPEVKLGDEVLVETTEGMYTYQVVSRRVVEPTEVSVIAPTETPTVTLITCYPDLIYTHRLVLRAEPVSFTPNPT